MRRRPRRARSPQILPGEVGAQHVRLAISPLEEVLNAVRALSRPGRSPVHARWATANRTAVDVPELVTVDLRRRVLPDFLSPPADSVDAQLKRSLQTPAEQVRLELEMAFAGRDVPPELLADPARTRDLLAHQVRECWTTLIEPVLATAA